MTKICLDAGHYAKYNTSPCNKAYMESKQMWKLHLYLKDALEKLGIMVVTTRADQSKDLALQSRGKLSNGCDLFLSLHSNAVGSGIREDIDYPVAYVSVDGKADTIGKQLAECVQRVMSTKQNARINKRVSEKDKDGNGKLDDDYYGVLVGCDTVGVPGIILEHSFHTNSKATEWLLKEENLEKLAEEEAKVIASYFGIQTDYAPQASITQNSDEKDIRWLQEKLAGRLKDFTEVLPLEVDGIYGQITRVYVLLYWISLGWNKDGKDDGWRCGKKTIAKLA